MGTFFEQLVNGLTVGSFYALVALGYSMVYGVMKLINFAHGDLFAFGSYLGYTFLIWGSSWITTHFGVWGGMASAILFAFAGTGIAGILVEKVAYRPVYPAGRLPLVVSALGMSIFLQNGIMAIWGPRFQAYPSETVPSLAFNLFGVHV
ncbi:MAG: branched-chain amino acid ABC transporter permease, partial [Atribacterota bacterium]